jgi:hypothetical protein
VSTEDPQDPQDPEDLKAAAERRRRLAEVFGDVLPDVTSDERDPQDGAGERGHDGWLRAQVPPHHG